MSKTTADTTTIFIRNLELAANIGIHKHEMGVAQPVRINIELETDVNAQDGKDKLEGVVDYETIAGGIRTIIAEGHISLAETLAERIAAYCLRDSRVGTARIRIEKLRAVAGAEAAGVEILRKRG
jgi:dihydroneopterin aldolase